ncbi:gastrula zinc finger protein XlCGF17.1-like [Ostrinia furnacalis]|uniref:gastrula zinc finger protein XlCGF17.1-like n=1 Tax=Ostrinia furnacalis TaxID=93504 RepID=UPI001040C2D7|nr:gastrula zinc finger protein XlCGF17.1-like [Ostrinia furnacalis]
MATSYFFLKILRRKRQKKRIQKRETEVDLNNFLDSTNSTKITCRICLKDGSVPIYAKDSAADLSEAVRSFGDIELSEGDEYPKYLCNACHSLLQGAILFRKSAKETEAILLNQAPIQADPTVELEPETFSETDNNDYSESTTKKLTSYKCKVCKLNFDSHKEYLAHKSSKQHRNVRIQCPICFGLLTPQLYKKHLTRHESASHLICDVCGKLYRKDNLVRHMQLHSFELPYQCQICPYRGRFMESLKIHMRTHTGDKPFSCDKCHLRFLTRSNLNRHLLTHKKDRPFKCVECRRGFYTQKDMDVHFKSDHAGIKDFGCRMCGNKYGTRKAFMRHELRVHKRDKMAKGRMPLYLQTEYRKE